ncbi:hypothetical protein KJ810_00135 [Patescibacteria group bacterium]|nr:hypothetical protein [Patescibacteria group bacterium]MBU2235541.1 hypothetical protein [Patescibacteria group bacterium]
MNLPYRDPCTFGDLPLNAIFRFEEESGQGIFLEITFQKIADNYIREVISSGTTWRQGAVSRSHIDPKLTVRAIALLDKQAD